MVVVKVKEDTVRVHFPRLCWRLIPAWVAIGVIVAGKGCKDNGRYGEQQCNDSMPIEQFLPSVVNQLADDEEDEVDHQVENQDGKNVLRDGFLVDIIPLHESEADGKAKIDDHEEDYWCQSSARPHLKVKGRTKL